MIKLKRLESNDRALLAVQFGKTRVGKSSVLGTLGKNTVLLHTKNEGHGAAAAAKVCNEKFGGKVSVFPVNLGVAEEADVELGIISNKKEVGRLLTPDETWYKTLIYIRAEIEGVGAIGVDSLTDLCNVIERTKDFEKLCTQNGSYNKWKERSAFETMFGKLIDALAERRDEGIDCICNVAAVYTYNDAGEIVGLKPDLSMFGIVDTVLKAFPDVFPLDRVKIPTENGGEKEIIAFVMNMRVGKEQFKEEGKKKVKKDEVFSNGRISSYEVSLPLGLEVDLLKADFSLLKKQIEHLKEEQGI